jgi:hypothetical protein
MASSSRKPDDVNVSPPIHGFVPILSKTVVDEDPNGEREDVLGSVRALPPLRKEELIVHRRFFC